MKEDEGKVTPAPEGKERLTAWAHWKRLEVNKYAAQQEIKPERLMESERDLLEAVEHVLLEMDKARIGYERYEKLRILSVRRFALLVERNMKGENFDAMVDAMPRRGKAQG